MDEKKVIIYKGETRALMHTNGYLSFGRITVKGIRYHVWFKHGAIRRDRVKSYFKKEMRNENQSK